MLLNWVRENFHPLWHLRRNSAAFRWLTRNVRIATPIHIKDIDHPVYVDLLRNPYMIGDPNGYERDDLNLMISLIRHRRLQRMFDIGANLGIYSFSFSANAADGRVIAFEPDRINSKLFEKTNARCPRRNIVLERMAVAKTHGTATFLVDDMSGATGTLSLEEQPFSARSYGHKSSPIAVETTSVDEASRRHFPPDFIKIDVEGMEYDVLKGAHHTLSSERPILLIEINSDSSKDNVQNLLNEFEYVLIPAARPNFLACHKSTDIQPIL